MSELRFSSSDEALQHLADLTGKRVRVAKKYAYVFDAPPTGAALKDIIAKHFLNKTFAVKRGNDKFQVNAIEVIGGTAYLIAVKTIKSLKELEPEEEEDRVTVKNEQKTVNKNVRTPVKLV